MMKEAKRAAAGLWADGRAIPLSKKDDTMTDLIRKVETAMLCNARQCWEHGIAAWAVAELGHTDLLLPMCHDMVIRQNRDGRLCDVENTPATTDPAICVMPVLRAAQITGDAFYRRAAEQNIAYLLSGAPRSEKGVLYHLMGGREIWADSAAMTPVVLAHAGHAEFAILQMDEICHCLYDPSTGLYSHIYDEATGTLKAPERWAGGNGWIAVGLAWLIPELQGSERERMLARYCALADAMDRFRMPSGLFHVNVDDPDSFADCEGAAMLAYSAMKLKAQGIRHPSVLREAKLALPLMDELERHVDGLGFIQDCSGSPSFNESGTSTEMQAFFLLLYAEIQKDLSLSSDRFAG